MTVQSDLLAVLVGSSTSRGPLFGVGSNTTREKGGGYLDGQLAKEQDRIKTTDAQRAAVAALGGKKVMEHSASKANSRSAGKRRYASDGAVRRWTQGMRLEVLANVAHELRTPLQVLLGYLDILLDEWAEKFDPEPRAILERMNSNLLDLAHTVDNIMEFVLSEAGAIGCVGEDVSITSLVNDLTPSIEAAMGGKQLALKIDIEDAPQKIHISRRALHSILSNLVLNAIKFTERGAVTVRLSTSSVSAQEPGLVVEVSDTGLGMSPALIKQAVHPFAQLSNSAARKYRGLGLGLAVVQRNVSALSAKLEVTSTPGQGSRFVVRIPPAQVSRV